jgi:hypothetical protein
VYATRPYGAYPERRSECLQDAASRNDGLFSEIAKMEEGRWIKLDEKAIRKAIEDVRGRVSDSEIQLCGLLGMAYRYAERDGFPPGMRQSFAECVLGFRYWDDEPGGDAMDCAGEGRSILFHTCEILAEQLNPERTFTNSNRNGQWHLEKGGRLATEWLQQHAGQGFEDWDSGACFAEIVLALSTLTGLVEKPQIMEMAALVMDKIFFTMAVNSFRGVFGSTHGRAYAPHIKTGYREPTSGITRLLWGLEIFNEHIIGPVGLACSSCELPPIIAAIAADQPAGLWSRERHAGGKAADRSSLRKS